LSFSRNKKYYIYQLKELLKTDIIKICIINDDADKKLSLPVDLLFEKYIYYLLDASLQNKQIFNIKISARKIIFLYIVFLLLKL